MNHIHIPNSYKEFANKKAEEVCYETGHKGVRCNYVLDEFDTIHPLSVTLVDYAGGKQESDVAVNVSSNEMQISDIALKKLDYIYYELLWAFILYKGKKQGLTLTPGVIDALAIKECFYDGKNLNDIEQGFAAMIRRKLDSKKKMRHSHMISLIHSISMGEINKSHSLILYELSDGSIVSEELLINAFASDSHAIQQTFADYIKSIGAKNVAKITQASPTSISYNTVISPSPEEKNFEQCPDCKVQLRVHPAYHTKHTLFCPQCGSIYKGNLKI